MVMGMSQDARCNNKTLETSNLDAEVVKDSKSRETK